MDCGKCGKKLKEEWKHCPECDTKPSRLEEVKDGKPPGDKVAKDLRGKAWFRAAEILYILCYLYILGIFLFGMLEGTILWITTFVAVIVPILIVEGIKNAVFYIILGRGYGKTVKASGGVLSWFGKILPVKPSSPSELIRVENRKLSKREKSSVACLFFCIFILTFLVTILLRSLTL